MASQFENAGLGMFGGERRFTAQGKDAPLRFLAGALLSPKVALPPFNTGPPINPDAAVPDAATQNMPIAPVSSASESAVPVTESAVPAEDKTESDGHPDVPAVMQDLGFDATTAPIKQQSVVSEKLSGISPDAFKPDRSQDSATLQALYTPNPNASQSVGQGGGGGGGSGIGGQIATSILSKLFTALV